MDSTRRRLLKAGLALPALHAPRLWSDPGARPTPACADDEPTPSQTAGPFYAPDSPPKADFRADDPAGAPLDLVLEVRDTACRPVAGAIVDLWHADSRGRYDNDGYRLRGHQRVDAQGVARFAGVMPGRYPYRTRHFHLRVFKPGGGRLLTTQLYFPDEPGNGEDGLFQPELVLQLTRKGAVPQARFGLIVAG